MAKKYSSAPELGTSAPSPDLPSAAFGTAALSTSAPEHNSIHWAPLQYSDSSNVDPSPSLPAMTGTGPAPWWRAPMTSAMLHTGLLSPATGPVAPTAAVPAIPEYRGQVTTEAAPLALPVWKTASSEGAEARPEWKAPPGPGRSIQQFSAPTEALSDTEFSISHGPPLQYSVPPPCGYPEAPQTWAHGIKPGMAPGMLEPTPQRMSGIIPGIMPRMIPGRMPGMIPRRMPTWMRGMMPRMVPRIRPGIPPAMMPAQPMMGLMPMIQGMPAFPGMMTGISPMPQQPPVVTPAVEPAAVPCHVSPATVVPPATVSDPRIVVMPISGGGGGSQSPGLIPFPLPMPMPLPMPSPGGGGSQTPVIVTGTSPPAPPPPQHPYPYSPPCTHQCPSPQQQSPINPLAETAAITMMMQQMRLLLSPREARRSRRSAPVTFVHVTSPPSSPESKRSDELDIPDEGKGTKGIVKTAGKRKKNENVEDGSSGSQVSVDGTKGKKKAVVTNEKKEQKKEDDKNNKLGSAIGTQGAESFGKGPSSSAPPLDLNFQSSSPLGQHITSDEEETTITQPRYLGYCCYALFVAVLVFFVILAVVPTILMGFKRFLGFTEKPVYLLNANISGNNKFQEREAVTGDNTLTPDTFVDTGETFGEVGVNDGLREFSAPIAEFNTVGYVFDWLTGVQLPTGTQVTVMHNHSPPPLPGYFNEHFALQAHRSEQNPTSQETVTKTTSNRHFDMPLPIDVGGANYLGSDQSIIFMKELDSRALYISSSGSQTSETVVTSEPLLAPIKSNSSDSGMKPATAIWMKSSSLTSIRSDSAGARAQSTDEGFRNDLELLGAVTSTDVPNRWNPKAEFLPYPDSVYVDSYSTDPSPSSVPYYKTTRRRQTNVTLSFFVPELPSRNVGRTFFYKALQRARYK